MKTLQEAWAAVRHEAVNAWYNEGGEATEADCDVVETALEGALEVDAASSQIERAAIIRLIKAHAKDCERRGAVPICGVYLALVSEIEDAMQHDSAHVEALENPPVQCGGVLAYEMIGSIRVHKDGVFRYLCPKCKKAGTNNGAARVHLSEPL